HPPRSPLFPYTTLFRSTAGQAEIDFRFSTLLKTADNLMNFKYVIKNVARQHGRTVTFMPKPIYQDNGSGMHCHQSLWKDGAPLLDRKSTRLNSSHVAIS